ncbi:MAG TPA: helix-turn-helix domain-containing protein [Polyangiaceae bacterium]|nr:helix-turn-helix domain-containing protein [Polyangiaceae bacterium]
MSLPVHITDAAARLVRRGHEGFTMGALAREAGLSRATLYRVAGSREGVLAALAQRGHAVAARLDARERILAACRVVFTRAGFDAATLDDVAREAGVGVATVYRHFKDKESMIVAFVDQLGPRRALRDALMQPSGDMRADLERVAAAMIRHASTDVDLMRLALLERLRGGRWAEHMKASPMRTLPLLERVLLPYVQRGELARRQGRASRSSRARSASADNSARALGSGDARRMAQAFAGMLFAFFARPALDGGPLPDPDEAARFITGVFLDGLATRRRS